jgi:hypothetical protein
MTSLKRSAELVFINLVILCVGILSIPAGILLIIFRRRAFQATVAGQRATFGRLAGRWSEKRNPNGNIYIIVGAGWILLGAVLILSAASKLGV